MHKEFKHEGLRHGCDKCDYKATQREHLKTHKQYKHKKLFLNKFCILPKHHVFEEKKKLAKLLLIIILDFLP